MIDLNTIPNCKPQNVVTEKEGYHISFNRSSSDYGCPTTAIYIETTSQFLILCGDHKEELEKLNFNECLEYFYNNIDKAHRMSEHKKIFTFNEVDGASYKEGGY